MTRADDKSFDLRTLLRAALDERPSDDFAGHVMERLSLLRTAIELGRLIGVAPVAGVGAVVKENLVKPEEGESNDDPSE